MAKTYRDLTIGELVDDFEEALEVGKQLRNPQNWETKIMRTGMIARVLYGLATVLGLAGYGLPDFVTEEVLHLVATALSAGIGGYLDYRASRLQKQLRVVTNPAAGLHAPAGASLQPRA
jgi:hypothetical protein